MLRASIRVSGVCVAKPPVSQIRYNPPRALTSSKSPETRASSSPSQYIRTEYEFDVKP